MTVEQKKRYVYEKLIRMLIGRGNVLKTSRTIINNSFDFYFRTEAYLDEFLKDENRNAEKVLKDILLKLTKRK